MLKRLSPLLACAAMLATSLDGRAEPATPAWTNSAAAHFWTPDRMEDAIPASSGTATHFVGIPTVGVLFSIGDDMHAHYCTASVVHSPHRDLILTAAHCAPGTNTAFVPQYASGAKRQPYGTWAVTQVYTDSRWTYSGPGSDYDFAFARVQPDANGDRLEDLTGGNRLASALSYRNKVTVVGYADEDTDADPSGQAITCTTTTSQLADHDQLRIDCGGFYGGTSGSPWLLGYNALTHTGKVIGLIGGLNGGGPDDRTSYSPRFGTAVQDLYARATRQ
jgi:V8-like Glu-specific endopeptidase